MESILALEHRERHAWAAQVAAINRRLNELAEEGG